MHSQLVTSPMRRHLPSAEQALMHENLKLQMDNDKMKASLEEKDVQIMEMAHVQQQDVQENQP